MSGDGDDRVSSVFASEGLHPHGWSNGPGATYGEHEHDHHKVLVCTAGSITFHTPSGDIALGPGDRLDLPAHTPHAATVGPRGVTCREAARR